MTATYRPQPGDQISLQVVGEYWQKATCLAWFDEGIAVAPSGGGSHIFYPWHMIQRVAFKSATGQQKDTP